jgi:peptide-methionine (S)-S-oxide reductase
MIRSLLSLATLSLAASFTLKHGTGTGGSKIQLHARMEATFGMGCFWKPSEELLKIDGVVDTVVGYTGKADATTAPTYDKVCFSRGWVEGVRVYYEDDKISYDQLLDAFFDAQNPQPQSRQYASIIFPHNDEQAQAAQTWLQQEKRRADGVSTRITTVEPLTRFFQAEEYHQRYWQKQRPRFAAIFGLLMLSTGVADNYFPAHMASAIHTSCNAATIALGLYQFAERKLDARVVEL